MREGNEKQIRYLEKIGYRGVIHDRNHASQLIDDWVSKHPFKKVIKILLSIFTLPTNNLKRLKLKLPHNPLLLDIKIYRSFFT